MREFMGIQEKSRRYDWSRETLRLLKAELDEVIASNPEVPEEPGGWWHQYVCPVHHTELIFDPLEAYARVYGCPHGCRWEGEPYRGAWFVFKHQAMARYILQAAAVYAGTGERGYSEFGKHLLLRYARQFPLYPVHPDAQPWMLKGRAFHQALTEAIWTTTILRGYLLLRDEGMRFDKAESRIFNEFLHMLESSMTEYHRVLTRERGNPENNYTAWLIAALFCIYAVQGDKLKMRELIRCEGGLKHHMSIAVRPDQLEFERSVYYHVFVLRAYLIAAEMGSRLGEDVYALTGGDGQSMEGMLTVLVRLADRNGVLPALHDGPYKRVPYAREIAEIMEIGLTVYENGSYRGLLAAAYRDMNGEQGRIGMLEALLYGKSSWNGTMGGPESAASAGPVVSSIILPHSGFALLRTEAREGIQALVDFGPHGGSHGHFDKLSLMVHINGAPLSPDRGTVPYGSKLKKAWYLHTACHNTVSIGERSQLPSQGACVRYESSQSCAYVWLRTQEAYEHAVLDRHLLLTEGWLLDWFEVKTEKPEVVDWWFHYIGSGNLVDAGGDHRTRDSDEEPEDDVWPRQLGTEDGYGYVTAKLTQRLRIRRKQLDLGITSETGLSASVSFVPFEGMECVQVDSPGTADDPSRKMEGILLRMKGDRPRFIAVFRSGDRPVELQWKASKEGGRLTLSDGKSIRSFRMTSQGLKEMVQS
ncbi:heparinase II/III family protein [Paenibacillus lactis]